MARKAAKRLTPKGVLALKKEGYYADSEAVGLYCQVAYRQVAGKLDKKHGVSRSWVYRFTSPVTKRVRWMGLGSCDVIPLAEARTLATAGRRLVTLGADPIEHRKATLAAEREAYLYEQASKMTFGDCVEAIPCRAPEEVPQRQTQMAVPRDAATCQQGVRRSQRWRD